MPLDFDLKHAVYGGAGAAVGAIVGYLLGIVLYVVVLSANAIAQSNIVTNSGVFPLLFAITFAALGFFGGFYISSKEAEAAKAKPAA
jgi:high-affinity Fe2+/Pb2+ permease